MNKKSSYNSSVSIESPSVAQTASCRCRCPQISRD